MIDGISGAPCPAAFPFSELIDELAAQQNFFPCVVAAIKWNETTSNTDPKEVQDGAIIPPGDITLVDPESILMPDGSQAGLGLMQLTSSFPRDWYVDGVNIEYAIEHFLVADWHYWRGTFKGDDLVRAIACSYNAGPGNATKGHLEGDLDKYTTNRYGERALAAYQALIAGKIPD